ncbi:nuclear transport factor 2 family protein [Geodermatophilus sp. CPCC 205506]|uniref:nuclear transport factor 2 family protein n=1 Tax=Geodermatophilus sp. CPCC 205506 TaxID=2936596 RepID=UPI003EEA0985
MDDAAVRAVLLHYLERSAAGDEEGASSIYHPDAVLEFPQSGERFEGVATFLPWRREYPATSIEYELDRVRGRGDVWVAELRIRYDGGPWLFGVDVLEFRGDEVVRESIYVAEGWDAPEWRARWRAAPPPTG